ncbi:MAG: alpha/beta hydrolase [Bacilli bacterium]|nr:alpha/beta hydrolase [Bacilli bacterium]
MKLVKKESDNNNIYYVYSYNFKTVDKTREISIYLPSTYDGKKKFPVIYMLDGQNLFVGQVSGSLKSWEVDKHIENLIKEQVNAGFIVVGIYAHPTIREQEYAPCMFKNWRAKKTKPQADATAAMILEIKELIDKEYKTLSDPLNTFIAGSSCGGIMVYYMLNKYKDYFNGYGIFSNAGFILKDNMTGWPNDFKGKDVFVYVGGNEGFKDKRRSKLYSKVSYEIVDSLYERNANVMFKEVLTNVHNEIAWSSVFEDFLRFISIK